jgi:hypothetical protein
MASENQKPGYSGDTWFITLIAQLLYGEDNAFHHLSAAHGTPHHSIESCEKQYCQYDGIQPLHHEHPVK